MIAGCSKNFLPEAGCFLSCSELRGKLQFGTGRAARAGVGAGAAPAAPAAPAGGGTGGVGTGEGVGTAASGGAALRAWRRRARRRGDREAYTPGEGLTNPGNPKP
jgi:hypothetical protein